MHNPYNANVKVSRSEMAEVGRVMAGRLNTASGPTAVMIPLKGWSIYGAPGGVLHDGTGNRILLKALQEHLKEGIQFKEIDAHINDAAFADACVDQLITYMEKEHKTP
jgi:uncharacterized protein (UPF0261 family)